jgi:hypothetical protein
MYLSKQYDKFDFNVTKKLILFNKLKNKDSIEVSIQEDDEDQKGLVCADKEIFDRLQPKDDETKEEYSDRINELMKQQIQGKVLDSHDRLVRQHEENLLKKLLVKRRVETEVRRSVRKRNSLSLNVDKTNLDEYGIFKEEVIEIGDDKQIEVMDSEVKQKGFYCDGVSYLDIMREKAFYSIPQDEKIKIFEEVMKAELDIEKATDVFLKNLYKDKKSNVDDEKTDIRQSESTLNGNTQSLPQEHDSKSLNDSGDDKIVVELREESTFDENIESLEKNEKDAFKLAAVKASKMDLKIKEKDLIQERKRKQKQINENFNSALERRNEAIQNSTESDQMFFTD